MRVTWQYSKQDESNFNKGVAREMKRKYERLTAPTQILIERLQFQLRMYEEVHDGLPLREQILKLLEIHDGVNKLGIALAVEAGLSSVSAQKRIREYLVKYKGEIIEANEFSAISGILDYGRRIRELRKEGLRILTGPALNPATGSPLRPDQYLLVD